MHIVMSAVIAPAAIVGRALGERVTADLIEVLSFWMWFVAPVTKSWEELGIDKKEMPAGTRASMNGEVPDAVTYEGWFKDQDSAFQRRVLGSSRYELFQTGEVGITEFARNGRILTLAELPVAP